MTKLSPIKARLASFYNAYSLAAWLRNATDRDHFVVRTGNPIQSVRVIDRMPREAGALLALPC